MISAPASLTYRERTYKPKTVPHFDGWRCLHVPEGGYRTPTGMPEVRPSENAQPVPMTAAIQRLSYELMTGCNENINGEQWRKVYGSTVAFTNNGNGFPGRADFVNGLDTTAELPRLMKAIICGGMFIRGQVIGDELVCVPGIHAIDAAKPMPSLETVIERNWYFHAVSWGGSRVNHFPQGDGLPILIPYILRAVTSYPVSWFSRWYDETLPNPLKVYL